MERKRVYTFGNGKAEGKADMRNLLGGKGANLAEMNLIGVPVPPGFTITTEVCIEYYELGKDKVVELLKADVEKAIANIETLMNSKFGDVANPLLVSVRSGARASMPGMMDTILNLGLNDEVVEGLSRKTGNARFAWDSYRRFVQMYGDVVLGMKPTSKEDIDPFEAIIEEVKKAKGVKLDNELDVEDLKTLVSKFKAAVVIIYFRTDKRIVYFFQCTYNVNLLIFCYALNQTLIYLSYIPISGNGISAIRHIIKISLLDIRFIYKIITNSFYIVTMIHIRKIVYFF